MLVYIPLTSASSFSPVSTSHLTPRNKNSSAVESVRLPLFHMHQLKAWSSHTAVLWKSSSHRAHIFHRRCSSLWLTSFHSSVYSLVCFHKHLARHQGTVYIPPNPAAFTCSTAKCSLGSADGLLRGKLLRSIRKQLHATSNYSS